MGFAIEHFDLKDFVRGRREFMKWFRRLDPAQKHKLLHHKQKSEFVREMCNPSPRFAVENTDIATARYADGLSTRVDATSGDSSPNSTGQESKSPGPYSDGLSYGDGISKNPLYIRRTSCIEPGQLVAGSNEPCCGIKEVFRMEGDQYGLKIWVMFARVEVEGVTEFPIEHFDLNKFLCGRRYFRFWFRDLKPEAKTELLRHEQKSQFVRKICKKLSRKHIREYIDIVTGCQTNEAMAKAKEVIPFTPVEGVVSNPVNL
jgi:hypothetical protein